MIDLDDIVSVLNDIRAGKSQRDAVIKSVYYDDRIRSSILSTMKRYGIETSRLDDILSQVIMQFIKTVMKKPELNINQSLNHYLSGIARFTILQGFKSEKKNQTVEIRQGYDQPDRYTPERLLVNKNNIDLLGKVLNHLGGICREVLLLWAHGYSMKEIAISMNYKSDMMARKKKYKCYKSMMDYLYRNPDILNSLKY